jgi:hypothetical protein
VAGIVTSRNINPGEYPGSRTLFTIQAITTVYAQLNASSEELDGVRVGDRVAVNAHGTTAARAGRVTAILGQAAPGSTNFTIKVEVPNASGALLAGMAVVGTIALAPTRGTLVPRASLARNETQIGVVRGATYHVVRVRIIAQDDANAIVTGVSPGTKVVTGSPDLRPIVDLCDPAGDLRTAPARALHRHGFKLLERNVSPARTRVYLRLGVLSMNSRVRVSYSSGRDRRELRRPA